MRKSTRLSAAAALITLYYGLCVAAILVPVMAFPQWIEWLPVGGIDELLARGAHGLQAATASVPADDPYRPVRLAVAIVGTVALVIPVSWVYFITTRSQDVDRSFVQTIVVLPVVVAGIAMVVQNSLALAFSLAGVVAAVRFRFTLTEPAHALYIFAAIGIGLSAGIGAIGIAAVISIAFVYVNLGLWKLDYGSRLTGPFFSFLTGRDRDEEDV
ncbi:MAG TPA: DUF4956 domain-containing protein [Gammaproteobacteria bacterium]|nr:DUF4956 domain-containing protein [Gammaproteobacteria bacterium]